MEPLFTGRTDVVPQFLRLLDQAESLARINKAIRAIDVTHFAHLA